MRTNNTAKNIKELRILKGLSQEKLGELAQISLRTVQRIENNETDPRGHSLQQIAAALETTPEQLAGANDARYDQQPAPEGQAYLTTISLSALSFMIFPLLGILIPFILWMIKRGEIANINSVAKRTIFIQSVWCLMLGYFYAVLFSGMPFFAIGSLTKELTLIVAACLLYFGNIVLILVVTFKSSSSKSEVYKTDMAV